MRIFAEWIHRARGVDQAMDALRDPRGLPWLDDLTRDVAYALRTFRRSPVFTAVALLTLAVGIGANAAVFSIVSGVILRPLGYPQPEQLMYLTTQFTALTFAEYGFSPLERLALREINRSFTDLGAFTIGDVNLNAADRPRRVRSASVDEHLLDVLGVQAERGRLFSRGESNASGALPPPIAILSHELWQTAFESRPIIGQTVDVDGRLHEVIGILPAGTDVMDNRTEIWLPLGLPTDRQYRAGDHFLSVIGRLKDGVTSQSAQTELNALLENWGQRVGGADVGVAGHVPTNHPMSAADHTIRMKPLQDAIVGDANRSIWMLQAAVGFVLLIACANLANLMMARAETRRREFGVRVALGASRGRLLRQSMTEGMVLSGVGGVAGLWLCRIGVPALFLAYPGSLPRTGQVGVDVPVLLFAVAVSVGTGLLFGLAPMAHTRVNSLVTGFKEGGHRGTVGGARHHIRRGLVLLEVALAVMLVIGAALLVRTARNLAHVDVGFDRSRLVTFSLTLPEGRSEPSTRLPAFRRLLDRLRAAPGVQAATAMSGLPPNRPSNGTGTFVENYTSPTGEPFEVVDYYQSVMSDYFETMGIRIIAGRSFEPSDGGSSRSVAVVNEALANRIWKGRSAIGQHLRPCCDREAPWYTVIGVARNVKQRGVDQDTGTEVYMYLEEQTSAPATINVMLRTALPPTSLLQTVERMVREIDPAVPIVGLRDMESVFAESIRRPRLLAQLLGAFAVVALLLAVIGTYGVLSYAVAQRRREIGIRIALGAGRASVVVLVMKEGLQLTIIGVVVGLAGAFGVTRLMASLLFGVQPTDPTTYAAVVATVTIAATIACWSPAFRASRMNPTVILRGD